MNIKTLTVKTMNAYQVGDIVYVLEFDPSSGYGIGRVIWAYDLSYPLCNVYNVQIVVSTHGDNPGDIYHNLGEDRMQPYFLIDGEPGSETDYNNPYLIPRCKRA